jgi:hypothetical protein
MIFAVVFLEAIAEAARADIGIALAIRAKADTLFGSAVLLLAVASPLPNRASLIAEALG